MNPTNPMKTRPPTTPPTTADTRLTDCCDAAAAIAAKSGGVVGVGVGVAVTVSVPVAVCDGVPETDGDDEGLVKPETESVGVREGVMDADAPNERDGVGVADDDGVVVGV